MSRRAEAREIVRTFNVIKKRPSCVLGAHQMKLHSSERDVRESATRGAEAKLCFNTIVCNVTPLPRATHASAIRFRTLARTYMRCIRTRERSKPEPEMGQANFSARKTERKLHGSCMGREKFLATIARNERSTIARKRIVSLSLSLSGCSYDRFAIPTALSRDREENMTKRRKAT